MDASDLRWLSSGSGYHVCVEVEDDDAVWVDFNAQWPEAYPDYTRCLIRMPKVSSQTEDSPGVYVVNADTLEVDNSPWMGTEVGFWDTDLPITLNRTDGAHDFTSWGGRRLRISLDFYGPNGNFVETISRGVFLIEDVQTSDGPSASILLSPVTKQLVEASAESVKQGNDWHKGKPLGSLIHLLAKSTDGAFDVNTSLATSRIDYGALATARASSWGPCPGILNDGSSSLYHWIPRCFAKAGSSLQSIYVGFEVPKATGQSSGAIAKFDILTGKWTIVLLPTDSSVSSLFPIALYVPSSGTIATAFCVTDLDPRTWHPHFHACQLVEFSKDQDVNGDPQTGTQRGSSYYFWPARYLLRRGIACYGPRDFGSALEYWTVVGYIGNADSGYSNKYYGENVPVPFPQAVDTLGFNSAQYDELESKWNGYQADDSTLTPASDVVALLPKTGSYSVGSRNPLTPTVSLMVRSWANNAYHGGILAKVGGTYSFFWIATTSSTWEIRAIGALTPWTALHWLLTNMKDGSSPTTDLLYKRQLTAYCWRTSSTTNRRMYVALIEWKETAQAGVPWSRSILWQLDFDGADGTEATCTMVWSHTPTGTTLAPMIVGLWTGQTSAAEPALQNDYTIVVVFNRGDMSGAPFGLGILAGASNTWIEMFTEATSPAPSYPYAGPTSAKPFGGFVWNWTDNPARVYFVDQASGQLWSVNPAATPPDWRLENNALPMHSEHDLATPLGGYVKTGSYESCLWGMAPSMPGEALRAEYERSTLTPIASRYVPGLYPLVQYGKTIADAVDVADFFELKVWEAIKMLKQRAWNYVLRITSTGQLTMAKRIAGSSVATLVPISSDPYPDVLAGEWPLYSWRKRTAFDQVANAVNVTPYQLQLAAETKVERTPPVGSKFAGAVQYTVRTERPLRLVLTCVMGGDILSTGKGILWRYTRVLETVKTYLAAACASADTTILIGEIASRGGRFYAGEHELRVGDGIRVLDGSVLTISAIAAVAQSSVQLTFGGTTIGINAPIWSVVSIIPQDGEGASDADDGVTTISSDTGTTTIEVHDGSVLRAGMAILVEQEYLLISAVAGNEITVARDQWNSTHAAGNHAHGKAVKAYVATLVANQMYDVGNTNVSFGIQLEAGTTDLPSRTILPGDSVSILSEGFRLKAMEHAIIHGIDTTSIAHGKKEKAIDDNRFLDLVSAELLDAVVLAAEKDAKTLVENGLSPLNPRITSGVTVRIADKKIVPSGTATDFEVLGCSDDYESGSMTLDLRSFGSI